MAKNTKAEALQALTELIDDDSDPTVAALVSALEAQTRMMSETFERTTERLMGFMDRVQDRNLTMMDARARYVDATNRRMETRSGGIGDGGPSSPAGGEEGAGVATSGFSPTDEFEVEEVSNETIESELGQMHLYD
jgi:hypothetical protein